MPNSASTFPAQSEASAAQGRRQPWLSILVPVFNVAPYVEECLQSITSQMIDGVEVILVDDHSTDGSKAICEQFCKRAGTGNFRIIAHDENKGIGLTRNSLLSAAKGEFIWFVDPDDFIFSGSIERLYALILNHSPDIVMCDYVKTSYQRPSFIGAPNVLLHDRDGLIRGVFTGRRLHLWSKISRRSLWERDLRFPDIRCFEDVAVTPWLLLRARSYYYAPESWVYYRVRPLSLTGLVSRTVGVFDDRKNDDLASAMRGYSAAVRESIPDADPMTFFAIAHFCAKEFTKISARLLGARFLREDWGSLRRRIGRYRKMMEEGSAVSFDALLTAYVFARRIDRWIVLKIFLLLSAPPQTGAPADLNI